MLIATLPDGTDTNIWLECNGQIVDSAKYSKLAALMVATPNYQGMFLRGYSSQTYTDAYGTVIHSSESLNVIHGDNICELTGELIF